MSKLQMIVEELLIENRIQATLTKPVIKDKTLPLVIFLHGFGTNKNEFAGIFKNISQNLLQYNICSLRINFYGYHSDGHFSQELSINSLVTDAITTIQYVQSLPDINCSSIGLCGFSLGAGIAILANNKCPELIKSMALLSPSGDFVQDFIKSHTNSCFEEMKKSSGPYLINMGWKKAYVHKTFLESLYDYNLLNEIKKCHCPTLLIAGSQDYTADHVIKFYKHSPAKIKRMKILTNTNHVFNNHIKQISQLPEVIDIVSSWYNTTLYQEQGVHYDNCAHQQSY